MSYSCSPLESSRHASVCTLGKRCSVSAQLLSRCPIFYKTCIHVVSSCVKMLHLAAGGSAQWLSGVMNQPIRGR